MTDPDNTLRDLAELYPAERGVREVKALKLLQTNWDGEGAEAPKPKLITTAILLLLRLPKQPQPSRVTATQQGNIILEWQFSSGHYLEAEISKPLHVEWMFEEPGHSPEHWVQDLAVTDDFLPLLPRQREAMRTVWEQWDELEQKANAEETK